ncbi:hypothetical protein [Microbacterium sp. Leaf159]|uniref:hypothetical protein n=1 Tax=Microbacterium sp. Leaf159 TaxID=1736279 RepID=UPI0006F83496|nr:hypothetical protein [Microbacterium sp. Leaf159]KQR40273.1 hypothetical protein ASF80_13355 [Microbacterium sp. Leaf159]
MSEPQQPPAQPYGTPPQGQGQPASPQYSAQQHSAQQYSPQQNPAPQNPAQPYARQPYPGSSSSSPASTGASLGRLAFIVALGALGIALLVTIAYPVIIRTLADPSSIGAFGAIGNGLVLIVAIVALILGLMSVRRPGQQVLAGIAIGISAAQITGILVAWVSNLFYALTY